MANYVTYEQMQIIAQSISNNFNAIDTAMNDTQGSITDEFDTSKNYVVGDIVIYDNTLYKCTSPHSAGEWNPNDFSGTTIAELIEEAKIKGSYDSGNLFIH